MSKVGWSEWNDWFKDPILAGYEYSKYVEEALEEIKIKELQRKVKELEEKSNRKNVKQESTQNFMDETDYNDYEYSNYHKEKKKTKYKSPWRTYSWRDLIP